MSAVSRFPRKGGTPADRPSLYFWLGVIGLACFSLASVAWLASSVLAQNGSEKL